MLLTEFIKNNPEWEKLLSAPPYCIKIKRDDGYLIFNYNQLTSDFNDALVRECRGVILDEATLTPVCVPFYKFGNYGEEYAAEIDWSSAHTQEKIDGSLMKVWFHNGKWRLSTSATINAETALLGKTDLFDDNCPYATFADLFIAAKDRAGLDYDKLDKNCTYMFELVSPYSKVIIMYDNTDIYHIGTRNNKTLQELNTDIGVKKPKEFALKSLDDCITAAHKLGSDKEGYVVVDKFYNRVKVKNPAYIALQHIKNNGEPSVQSLIEIIRNNEVEEFLTYFPELASKISDCKNKIDFLLTELESTLQTISNQTFETQKDFAIAVKDKPLCGFYFRWRLDASLTPKEWFWGMSNDQIKNILGNLR